MDNGHTESHCIFYTLNLILKIYEDYDLLFELDRIHLISPEKKNHYWLAEMFEF